MAATSGPQAKAQQQSKRPVVDSGQSCTHRKGCRITDDKTSDRWPLCLAHKLMHSTRAKDYWWISKKALHTGNGVESLMTRHIYIYIYIKGSIKASAQLQSKPQLSFNQSLSSASIKASAQLPQLSFNQSLSSASIKGGKTNSPEHWNGPQSIVRFISPHGVDCWSG